MFLDPILAPILKLPLILAIIVMAFLISVIITFIYKWTTNQDQMRILKKELKKYQEEMKQYKEEPDKMMKIQKKAMDVNMKYMGMSMKPTLYTFIPIILLFGWMKAHLGFYPLVAGEDFFVTALSDAQEITLNVEGISIKSNPTQIVQDGTATWELNGEEGTYLLEFTTGEETQTKKIVIGPNYENPDQIYKDSIIRRIIIGNEKVKPLKNIPIIGSIPWIGNFGWLGTYIIFSIIFSMSLRKILKIS